MLNNTSLQTQLRSKSKQGSGLVIVLLLCFLMFFIMKGFLPSIITDYKVSSRNMQKNIAFYIAEAGAEEAMWALNNFGTGDWSTHGWTQAQSSTGDSYWKREINFSSESYNLGNGLNAKVRLVVEEPVIGVPTKVYSEGIIAKSSGEQR